MERQAGLGRSLEDVLDSLAPIDTDPSAPGRVLFEPGQLERGLDQLMVDIEDLRARVKLLVGQAPDAAVANGTAQPVEKRKAEEREHKGKQHNGKKHEGKQQRHTKKS